MTDHVKALSDELERIGVTKKDFCNFAQISHSAWNSRMYNGVKFKLADIVKISDALEAFGGEPTKVWPNANSLRQRARIKNTGTNSPPERIAPKEVGMKRHSGKPLYENSIKRITNKIISVPGFEDSDIWIRTYDQGLMPKYIPGQIFALKEIKPVNLIFGKLYYVVLEGMELFRVLNPGRKPDSIIMAPVNPEEFNQEIYLSDITELYLVIGSIQRI